MIRSHRFLIPLLALTLSAPGWAGSTSNLAREKSWADQIVDTLIAGEALTLEATGTKFLALYTAPAKTSRKGLILLHGRGVHPAWGFIDTLRIDLADAGWHTLSLQLPILESETKMVEYDKTFPEAFARIDAGVNYLRKRGIGDIALIGHSSGGMTAVAYAAERPSSPVKGIATIGLTTEPAGGPFMNPVQMLEKVKKPVLDIYGADDLPNVLQTVKERQAAARKAGNSLYTQERVPGANHFFSDQYDALRTRLSAWLDKRAK